MGQEEAPGEKAEAGARLPCPFCSYVSRDRADYRAHLLEEHPDKAD